MADPIVRTVYLGGEFTSADVGPASIALIYYSIGIFAWAGQAIVARGFFAMQDTLTPIILGSIVTVIFIPLNYMLMRVMGHAGLAFATSIAAGIHLFGLIFFLRKRINGLEGRKVMSSVSRVCVASAVMTAACIGTRMGMAGLIDVETKRGAALTVLVAMAVAGIIYLAMLKLLRVEEADFVVNLVRRRLSRRSNGSIPPPGPTIDVQP
jgi:putative peptidoglycan lipid II flippase